MKPRGVICGGFRGVRLANLLALACCLGSTGTFGQAPAPYRDAKLPVDQRVADLLSRMTLDEKIAQLVSVWEDRTFFKDPQKLLVDEKGNFLPDRAAVMIKNGLGEFSRPSDFKSPREAAEFTNTGQKWVWENTRLGIPVVFHDECLHGHVAPGGTSYPQAIALASTWDPALIHDVF